jgi:hypothetical protein
MVELLFLVGNILVKILSVLFPDGAKIFGKEVKM